MWSDLAPDVQLFFDRGARKTEIEKKYLNEEMWIFIKQWRNVKVQDIKMNSAENPFNQCIFVCFSSVSEWFFSVLIETCSIETWPVFESTTYQQKPMENPINSHRSPLQTFGTDQYRRPSKAQHSARAVTAPWFLI